MSTSLLQTSSHDALHLESGSYAKVQNADEFGERIFTVVDITWNDLIISYLNDAASDWGIAPWAMLPILPSMKILSLGSWEQLTTQHKASITLVSQAAHQLNENEAPSALLLIRASLRLENSSYQSPLTLEAAMHAFESEVKFDKQLKHKKQSAFLKDNPNWDF